jgi:hypothetical protein
LNFRTFIVFSKTSNLILKTDIVTKCNTNFTYLNNTNTTNCSPLGSENGALVPTSILVGL